MAKLDPKISERIETLMQSMGYEWVGCEWLPQGRQGVLRVYIDKEGSGVTADDCSLASRQIGALLDVEDWFQGRYILEISSPGIDRPLFTLEQFKRQVGNRVRIRLLVPINTQRQFKGTLVQIVDETLHLQQEDGQALVELPFQDIDKANVIGETGFPKSRNS